MGAVAAQQEHAPGSSGPAGGGRHIDADAGRGGAVSERLLPCCADAGDLDRIEGPAGAGRPLGCAAGESGSCAKHSPACCPLSGAGRRTRCPTGRDLPERALQRGWGWRIGSSRLRWSVCLQNGAGVGSRSPRGARSRSEEPQMAKVLCVLYDDPVDGYPSAYARDEIPRITSLYRSKICRVLSDLRIRGVAQAAL